MASPAGGKSRIDSMGIEDLQQFAKKQMLMLKNLKNKTDAVTKERDSIKKELSQRTEEHECLAMKTTTLEQTLRELQNEKKENQETGRKADDMEFQYEELKLKYEEQEERTEKFRTMAKSKIDALQSEKNDAEDAKHDLETQIDQVMAERNDRVKELSERIKELEQEVFNESREDSLGELEIECEKLHKIIEDLKDENARLQNESSNTDLESEISKLKPQLEQLINENEELKGQQNDHVTSLNIANSKIENLEKSLSEAESKNSSLESELESTKKDSKNKLDTMTLHVNDLRAQLETSTLDKSGGLDEIIKLRNELEENFKILEEERGKSEKALETMEAQCAQWIDDTKAEHTAEIDLATKEGQEQISKLETQIEELKSKNGDLENKIKISTESTEKQLREISAIHRSEIENISKQTPSKESELQDIISRNASELVFFKEKIAELESTLENSTPNKEVNPVNEQTDCDNSSIKIELEEMKKKFSESEAQNKKLKQLALKTKKEMDQTKKKLTSSEEERKKVQDQLKVASSKASSATSSFQTEYDKLQDELDQTKDKRNNLQTECEKLKEIVEELSNEKEEKLIAKKEIERLTEKLTDTQSRLDESMGREVQLESEMVQEKRARLDEKNTMAEKLTKAEKFLEQEKTRAMQSSKEMEDIKESMKTQQLINMEMKDYERAVNELKNQLEIKINESNSNAQDGKQLQELLDQVRQRATAAEEALEAAEERSEKYRAMIDEANIELNQFKEKEYKAQSQIELSSAAGEQLRAQVEEMKIQLSSFEAKNAELLDQKKTNENKREREKIQTERELSEIKKESSVLKEEKDKIEKEYTAYKARVHTVLKQQKEQKTDPDQLQQAKEALLTAHDQIKKLHTSHEELKLRLCQSSEEIEKVRNDNESKSETISKLEESSITKERALLEKIKSIEVETTQAKLQNQQFTSEIEQIRIDSKRRLDEVETKARSELGLKLSMSERRAAQLETENHQLKIKLNQKEVELEKSSQSRDTNRKASTYGMNSMNIDVTKMERKEPIGAEQDEDTSSVLSLEHILQSPTKSFSTKSETPAANAELFQKVQILEKKIEHQSSILRESEATNARLSEQTGLLKAEIRRLEKNQERKDNIHNLEYLKNVILKFMTLPPGTEKTGLIPVLETMLQFDQKEKDYIFSLATGDDAPDSSKAGGWGSYLPRWGGL